MAGRKADPTKRAQILRAATAIFSTRDFYAVPVDDIATAAGVGKGTLYLYFPTKEQLFYASILDALDALIGELARVTAGRRGEDALRAYVAGMLDFFWRRRQLVVLMHRYEHKLREPEGGEWRTRRATMVAGARALVQPMLRAGNGDATLATEMLLAMIRAAILNHQQRDRPERLAQAITAVFLHGVATAAGRTWRPLRLARAAGARR